jgi:hypothetical protein
MPALPEAASQTDQTAHQRYGRERSRGRISIGALLVDHENIAIRVVHHPCRNGAEDAFEPAMVPTAADDDQVDVEDSGATEDV